MGFSLVQLGTAAVMMHKANAGMRQMKANLQIETSRRGGNRTNVMRSLTDHLLQEYFMPYGCWCNFDDNQFNMAGKGHGTAKDEWDANCRKLQEGYECAIMDAEDRGEPCVPWSTDYPIAGAGISESIIEVYCTTIASSNLCAAHACIVESHFVNRIADFIIPGQSAGFANLAHVNSEFLHSNNFDMNGECQIAQPAVSGGGGAGGDGHEHTATSSSLGPKQCCGKYPERFPYRANTRSCCESSDGSGKTFDEATHLCCSDGTTTAIGNDCV